MWLTFRVLQVLLKNIFQPRLKSLSTTVVETFRVMPFDLDIFKHMNNARYLTYLEAIRWVLMLRTGLIGLAYREKWNSPLSHIDIRYLRPLKPFQKFTVSASIIQVDDRFLHVYQEFRSGGKLMAQALVTGAVRSKEGSVAPEVYLGKLGYRVSDVVTPNELRTWLKTFSGA